MPPELWDEIADEVSAALTGPTLTSLRYFDGDTVLMPADARDGDPLRVDEARREARMLASERDFVRRVWSVVAPLAGGPRPVVVLFDVDQTLGSRKHRGSEAATLVRPSAVPLMRALHDAGVLMGILTSRGTSGLHEDLADALHLRSVAPFLDPQHLNAAGSEHHAELGDPPAGNAVDAPLLRRFAALLPGELREPEAFRAWRDERGRPLPPIDVAKLVQLAGVREEHPDAVLVVVDDRDYVGLLPGPDVVGVHLTPDERAHY